MSSRRLRARGVGQLTHYAPRATIRGELDAQAQGFADDVHACPTCKGRMKLLAIVTDPKSIARHVAAIGEPINLPVRSPSRGLPYWNRVVLRRKALGEVA